MDSELALSGNGMNHCCMDVFSNKYLKRDTRSNKINLILPVAKQHRATVDAISVSSDDRALYFSKSDYSLQKFDLRQNKVIVEYVPPRHGSFGKIHHIVVGVVGHVRITFSQ